MCTIRREEERPAKHWGSCLAPVRGGGSALRQHQGVHTAHGGWLPAVQGQPASPGSCSHCRIHSQSIIKPQPLIEPPKMNHSFRPDPAPTPNPGWRHGRAEHQGGVREEPRGSTNLEFLHEQLPVSDSGCRLHRRLRGSAGSEPSSLDSSSSAGPSHCNGHEPLRPSHTTSRGPPRWHPKCHSSWWRGRTPSGCHCPRWGQLS